MPPPALALGSRALQAHANAEHFVIHSQRGTPVSRSAAETSFRRDTYSSRRRGTSESARKGSPLQQERGTRSSNSPGPQRPASTLRASRATSPTASAAGRPRGEQPPAERRGAEELRLENELLRLQVLALREEQHYTTEYHSQVVAGIVKERDMQSAMLDHLVEERRRQREEEDLLSKASRSFQVVAPAPGTGATHFAAAQPRCSFGGPVLMRRRSLVSPAGQSCAASSGSEKSAAARGVATAVARPHMIALNLPVRRLQQPMAAGHLVTSTSPPSRPVSQVQSQPFATIIGSSVTSTLGSAGPAEGTVPCAIPARWPSAQSVRVLPASLPQTEAAAPAVSERRCSLGAQPAQQVDRSFSQSLTPSSSAPNLPREADVSGSTVASDVEHVTKSRVGQDVSEKAAMPGLLLATALALPTPGRARLPKDLERETPQEDVSCEVRRCLRCGLKIGSVPISERSSTAIPNKKGIEQ
mmetsp:Transcript_95099/g.171708  ORF Transcript_95099/g.171708 Transcript_95099/m.171708 type:complete len:472 (+) Transcript_95099:39-1454(+)